MKNYGNMVILMVIFCMTGEKAGNMGCKWHAIRSMAFSGTFYGNLPQGDLVIIP